MSLIKSISGIRGTIGGKVDDNLTPVDVVKFTAAFGTWLQKNKNKKDLKPSSISTTKASRPAATTKACSACAPHA